MTLGELHLHLEFSNSCNNPICCIQRNTGKRYVVGISEEQPSQLTRCWNSFKRACCCCCVPNVEEEKQEMRDRLGQLMIKQIGELPAQTAQQLADIDWERKRDDKKPLSEEEVRKILKKAEVIQHSVEELDRMVATVRYASSPPPKSEEEIEEPMGMVVDKEVFYNSKELPPVKKGLTTHSSLKELDLHQLDISSFVRNEMTLIPSKSPLTDDQISLIVQRVDENLRKKEAERVNKVAIRQLIHKEVWAMKIPVESPRFLRHIDLQTQQTLCTRGDVGELTPREYAALVKALKKEKKANAKIDEVGIRIDEVD